MQPHLHLDEDLTGAYALLPGDPGRCEQLASRLDGASMIARNREYETWRGTYGGATVVVTSTGIGGPSTAIAVEELARCGVNTMIRVGTAGSMSDLVVPGDLVVASGAIRDGGTSRAYLPLSYPAVPDFTVTDALRRGAASAVKVNVHVGVSQEKDSYYGQHSPRTMPVVRELEERWKQYRQAGALCSEMESATLFVVGAVRWVRTGALMLVGGHPDMSPMTEEEQARFHLSTLIDGVYGGLSRLIAEDR